ncbi:MAG: type II secretion system F family protein [Gemmatimonadota bacterium]
MTATLVDRDAFRYRASTESGAIVEGVLRAASRDAALRELRRQQLWPVTLDVVAAQVAPITRWRSGAGARRRSVAAWVRTVATLLDAGAPLDRALGVAHAQCANVQVRDGAQAIRVAVQGGASLADAMRLQPALFDALHVGVVRAGEAAGALDGSLATLAGYLEEDAALRAQLTSALIYPALMATVATLGIVVLLLFVVPRFSALLSDLGGTMPWSTRTLVFAGSVVTRGWWVALLGVGATGFAVRTALASPARLMEWHRRRVTLPLVGPLERAMATARYTRALGLMLSGGLPLLPALRLARSGVTNHAIAADLDRATQDVARGVGLARALEGTLSPMAVQLLAVGEESGRLDTLCLRAAGQHDEEVRRTLRTLATLLEPALILLFGAIVGFVALAMLQAIYAVNAGM